jgi:hypothetical protein
MGHDLSCHYQSCANEKSDLIPVRKRNDASPVIQLSAFLAPARIVSGALNLESQANQHLLGSQ